jgi:hypothetical protein
VGANSRVAARYGVRRSCGGRPMGMKNFRDCFGQFRFQQDMTTQQANDKMGTLLTPCGESRNGATCRSPQSGCTVRLIVPVPPGNDHRQNSSCNDRLKGLDLRALAS